jgi:ribosome maturation protein Sdo1
LKINVKSNQPAKKQALGFIDQLKEILPLERAKIRIKMSLGDSALVGPTKEKIAEKVEDKEYEIE